MIPTNMRIQKRTTVFLMTLFCAGLFCAQTVHGEDIGEQLQNHAPKIVEYLNAQNIKTVGVLKFRVKKPGKKTSDRVGPINSLLADRLEVGLILANPFDESKQLNIIKDASEQVTKINGANHLTEAGRAAFFGPEYRLAWGDKPASANAFLTGVVQVHEDNQRVTVGILCFDNEGGELVRACDVFEADLDATSLGEMGESFVLRGAFDNGDTELTFDQKQAKQQTLVLNQSAKVKSQQESFPLVDPTAPLRLEVTYDGQVMPIEMRDGAAFLPEPQEGQDVEFTIVRSDSVVGNLGVVLKVNGENTLYRQTVRDLDCGKWILSAERPQTVVRGYQLSDRKTIEKFRVLSDQESAERAVDYGRSVGQVQVTVFGELTGAKPRSFILDDNEEDLVAMLRGVQPTQAATNLSALKHQIRQAGRKGPQTRGLIVQGEKASNVVSVVKFQPNPTPVMAATITYYTP